MSRPFVGMKGFYSSVISVSSSVSASSFSASDSRSGLGCRFAATATTATFFGGFAVVFGLLVVEGFRVPGFR